ncbi:histone deacetylase [Stygiomarasmius scandens]|uniref:Histone deacetylase n=1 Tax=Marasmiellus scandens TaxID=2682957 RepID=A0ABR1JKS4_9AGAR
MLPNSIPNFKTAILIQDACYQHRYIRSKDLSAIVERPERIRAVKVGLSAAIARIEEAYKAGGTVVPTTDIYSQTKTAVDENPDELVSALDRLNLGSKASFDPQDIISKSSIADVVSVFHSSANIDILNNAAVKFIHGDIDGDLYLINLTNWIKESTEKIGRGESEIPSGLAQGDLYLCPGSLNAIQGALGTVCESVDLVLGSPSTIDRAFVAIRPPGHHCGEDTPSGFCFVNNVAVAAAHAHLKYGVQRVVIFDIDLHHGNGTQSIVWQINEETYRKTLESEGGSPNLNKPGPKVFYGSLHDVLSYPCEDGNATLVQAASVSIHGAHGQYIENVHLKPYESERHFWDIMYPQHYSKIISKAEEFIKQTDGTSEDTLVFISCGLDACEHEYESMSRHGRKVPTSFYHRFTRDAVAFAERYARGKVISVLEGGYSDRALISGSMAHLVGLTSFLTTSTQSDDVERWWNVDELTKIEAVMKKKRRGGRVSLPGASDASAAYLARTLEVLNALDPLGVVASTTPSRSVPLGPSSMTLRERKKPTSAASGVASSSASASARKPAATKKGPAGVETHKSIDEPSASANTSLVMAESDLSELSDGSLSDVEDNDIPTENVERKPLDVKKLPRVILKLGPNPSIS